MKALVLISELAAGGAERVTVTFMRRLAARGIAAHLATVTSRHDSALVDELEPSGIVRHDLGAVRLADPRLPFRLRNLVRREGYDVVHAHGQDAAIVAAMTRPIARFGLVITRHVLDEPSSTWRESLRRRAALWALSRADAVVAVSSAAAASLAGQVDPSRMHVLFNGIDAECFASPDLERRRNEIRQALGASDEPLVLLLAVLRAGKGHEVALAAWPGVLRQAPRARLLIAGSGERESELRELAKGLGGAVSFLGERQDVAELLAACDCVVLPSFAEALPTVLIEAAAAARPVVATRVGGTPDVVEDGVSGLLVSPGDPAALSDALVRVLSHRELGRQLGNAGRQRARRLFALDTQVDATLALWRTVAR